MAVVVAPLASTSSLPDWGIDGRIWKFGWKARIAMVIAMHKVIFVNLAIRSAVFRRRTVTIAVLFENSKSSNSAFFLQCVGCFNQNGGHSDGEREHFGQSFAGG